MAKVVYEVKIFKKVVVTKTETRGSTFVFKQSIRWKRVCTLKYLNKRTALEEITFWLSTDIVECEQYKYSIRVLKGGKKRGKR